MIARILFNPRVLVLAIGFLVALGATAIQTLPRLEDPTIQSRSATILTFYPGADAERVEALVTKPIEDAIRTLADVQTVESTSRTGTSVVTVELKPSIFDTARVWSRVRDKLADVAPTLPQGVTPPNLDDERGYAYTIVAAVRWTAEGPPNGIILRRYALELQDRLRNVAGTDYVKLHGAAAERIDVVVDPNLLATAGLSVDAVARALSQADVRASAGEVVGSQSRLTVELGGAFDNLDRLRDVSIASGHGRTLKLSDVATLSRGLQEPPAEMAFIDGARAIAVGSRMQPAQRVDQWVARAQAAVDTLRAEAPVGIGIDVVFEQAGYTARRLSEVVQSLLLGLVIVVGVLFVTMGWRSAVIVGLAVPMTALLALGLFRPFGIDIHQMSITGMIVALGLMVDNAIIMTNAIRDDIVKGRQAAEAVLAALRNLWAPLLASTVTTILAFMPIVLLPGTAGEFVGPLALAVIIALISSYIVSLFFVPAFTPFLFRAGPAAPAWWRTGVSIGWLSRAFRTFLGRSLRYPLVSIAFALSLPIIGIASMPTIKQVFFPPTDRDQFYLTLRLPPSASIAETERTVQRVDAVLRTQADIARILWFLGSSAPTMYYNVLGSEDANPAFAQAIVDTTSDQATARLIPLLQSQLDRAFPEVETQVFKYEQGPPVTAPIEVRIVGQDLGTLVDLGQQIAGIMSNVPSFTHARALVTGDQPKLTVRVAEDEALLSGLDLSAIAGQLDAALTGRAGGFILEGTEQIPVTVRYPGSIRGDAEALGTIPVTVAGAPAGTAGLPLSAVARTELVPSWSGIQHRNGERLQVIRGYLEQGTIPADALARFQAAMAQANLTIPPGYRLEIGGEAEERGEAVGLLLGSVAMLLVLMVTTVALTFNSFRATAIVFLAGFQTLGIGLLSLKISGHAFGFIIIVGIMGLVGVAINATIMILSAFRSDDRARHGDIDAMVDILSGPLSRHIWSTTITTVGGFVPLILAPGEFWPPFAETFAGGLLLATVIAFLFTPAAWRLVAPGRPQAAERTKAARRPADDRESLLPVATG